MANGYLIMIIIISNTTHNAQELHSCWNVLVPSLLLNEKEQDIDVTMHWTVNGNDNRSRVGNADLDLVTTATSDAACHWLDQAMQVLEQLPSTSDQRQ